MIDRVVIRMTSNSLLFVYNECIERRHDNSLLKSEWCSMHVALGEEG
jgi:hypothetical protein